MTQQLQTPYFLIHKNELDAQLELLQKALHQYWPNSVVGYSYKTNTLPWVIDYFYKQGCYAEVVSDDEYRLGKHMGVQLDRFVYNGPIKTKDTFLEALKAGSYVNIDSQREIDWLRELDPAKQYNLGIRVNFDLESICPGHTQCPAEGGRFGFCYENGEFEKALRKLEGQGFKISGLHLHTSSKSRGLDIYRAIAEMACCIADKYNLQLDYVDVGGGFFGGLPTKPQFADYISLMADILKEKFDPQSTTLIVEPGMAVIGATIKYVTTVIDIKDTEYNRFVITDGSRTNIDPLMTKNGYFHHYIRQKETQNLLKQVVCGYTCMEHDRLITAKDEPALCVGDQIIYEKVGAYTMCLTPLFIKYFPDVYVNDGQTLQKIRNAWSPEEYVQKSIYRGM